MDGIAWLLKEAFSSVASILLQKPGYPLGAHCGIVRTSKILNDGDTPLILSALAGTKEFLASQDVLLTSLKK